MNKILVVGASGLVGTALMHDMRNMQSRVCQYDYVGTYHSHPIHRGVFLDITDYGQLRSIITSETPDTIIWLAGSKDHQQLQKTPEIARILNQKPVEALVEILENNITSTKLIYVSTDYVFDGTRGGYKEYDQRAPDTVYGRSKMLAEDIISSSKLDYCILRTSAIMYKAGGFLGWLIKQLEQKEEISLFHNTVFTPTPAVLFSRAILRVIKNDQWREVLHIAGPATSRYELGKRVAEILGYQDELIRPIIVDFDRSTFHKNLSLVTSEKLKAVADYSDDLIMELMR
jgi:dTDP-4-dehydrorhamnose reductase